MTSTLTLPQAALLSGLLRQAMHAPAGIVLINGSPLLLRDVRLQIFLLAGRLGMPFTAQERELVLMTINDTKKANYLHRTSLVALQKEAIAYLCDTLGDYGADAYWSEEEEILYLISSKHYDFETL